MRRHRSANAYHEIVFRFFDPRQIPPVSMYLNVVQIAESFGVTESVVEDWMRNEGLPHIPDRGRLLFDRAQVAHWAAAHGLAEQVLLGGEVQVHRGSLRSGLPALAVASPRVVVGAGR